MEMREQFRPPKSSGFDFQILPSGRRIPITVRADPSRPWGVRGSGTAFEVFRQRRGDSSVVEIYAAGRVFPMVLNEVDAKALAAILNARLRPPRPRPDDKR